MVRLILGVVVGYMVWTVIWLGGNAVFFAEAAKVVQAGERYDAAGPLAGAITLSIVCSLAGGAAAGAIGGAKGWTATIVTAALLLITGIGVQAGAWEKMPVWYHLMFLVLLVPVTLAGGRMACRGKPAASE